MRGRGREVEEAGRDEDLALAANSAGAVNSWERDALSRGLRPTGCASSRVAAINTGILPELEATSTSPPGGWSEPVVAAALLCAARTAAGKRKPA